MLVNSIEVSGFESALKFRVLPHSTNLYTDIGSNEEINRVKGVSKALATAESGSGHDNFLKGIIVHLDLTATQNFWLQFMRYHFHEQKDPITDIVSSSSKMHSLLKMDLTECFHESVHPEVVLVLSRLIEQYKKVESYSGYEEEGKQELLDKIRLQILTSCPSGLLLRAGVVTNFAQLKNMIGQRKHHFLPEWKELCKAVSGLPEWKTLFEGSKWYMKEVEDGGI